ncbi:MULTISPECIES: hypothetical protein [Vibrio]|uniref:hypothetical protein n=1 Tax=Vibrio TaxID=662 RepID=UPI003D0CA9E5
MRNFINTLTRSELSPVRHSATVLQQFLASSRDYQLSQQQKQRVETYLGETPLSIDDYGNPLDAHSVIAFSFGDSDDVNSSLAQETIKIVKQYPFLDAHLQQEVATHAINSIKHAHVITSESYLTTTDIAKQALARAVGRNVIVVAQSWHAKRCIETCEEVGLNVVAVKTVNRFPAEDPQPWVRNPINWILKESHRAVATGVEISKKLNLA